MDLVYFLLVGLLAGWLAGQVTKGRGFGLVGNLVVGVIGAILGGYLLGLLGFHGHGLLASLLTAFFGAVALLWALRFVKRL